MKSLRLDISKAMLTTNELGYMSEQIKKAHNQLHAKTGAGSDFLGWMDHPVNYDKAEFDRIIEAAEEIKSSSEILIIIGIGGSYMGARAAIEMLRHSFYNMLPKSKRRYPAVYFLGNNFSSIYMKHLFELIEGKEISVCVISKSGTTTEPAIAFRQIKAYLEERYGKEKAAKRVYIITDANKGVLKLEAEAIGYKTFVIPDNIAGRYSVLTSVGLLPLAAAGLDIHKLLEGAAAAREEYSAANLIDNECYKYAAMRNILYKRDKAIEVLISYEPTLQYFMEWWKQLFAESEGKDGKGIFPASMLFSTDLHSLGQYVQDGTRNLFETIINIEKSEEEVTIIADKENLDDLNFISDKTLDYVNKQAFKGTVLAHNDGGVPIGILNVPELNEYYFGQLVYYFEKACAISGHLLGVNPFDQPGVEEYKKNMFALLGKPGYEELKNKLEGRL
ncbi:MAG: glucose-6-phosphate isomerase [Lutisporaceae bacterium]